MKHPKVAAALLLAIATLVVLGACFIRARPRRTAPLSSASAPRPDPSRPLAAPAPAKELDLQPTRRDDTAPTLSTSLDVDVEVVARDGGAPIPGARVESWDRGGESSAPLSAARTDEAGRAHLATAPSENSHSLLIRAQADGFAIGEAEVDRRSERRDVRIELATGGFVAGRVAFGSGYPARHARVVLWPRALPRIDCDRCEPSSRWDAGRSVFADDDGRFRVDGLIAGETYRLKAGMLGAISTAFEILATATTDDVKIVLTPVFAAIVELVDAGGGALHCGSNVGVPQDSPTLPAEPSATWAADPAVAVLAGIPKSQLAGLNRHRRFYMVASDTDLATFGPMRLQVLEIGYEFRVADFDLPRVDGSLTTVQIALQRQDHVDFGDLRIVVDDPSAAHHPIGQTDRGLGTLYIHPKTYQVGGIEISVPASARDGFLVKGLRSGSYEAQFRSAMYHLPNRQFPLPLTFTVGPDIADLTLHMGHRGKVHFALPEGSRSYQLSVTGELRPAGIPDKIVWPFMLLAPPYEIDDVPAGDYDVKVRTAFPVTANGSKDFTATGVQVIDDEDVEIRLQVSSQ